MTLARRLFIHAVTRLCPSGVSRSARSRSPRSEISRHSRMISFVSTVMSPGAPMRRRQVFALRFHPSAARGLLAHLRLRDAEDGVEVRHRELDLMGDPFVQERAIHLHMREVAKPGFPKCNSRDSVPRYLAPSISIISTPPTSTVGKFGTCWSSTRLTTRLSMARSYGRTAAARTAGTRPLGTCNRCRLDINLRRSGTSRAGDA